MDGVRSLLVLAGEHQLKQRGVACREAHAGARCRPKAWLELLADSLGRLPQLGFQARKAGLGERVEQRLTIGKVSAWRGVAHADLTREVAQRQALDAVFPHAVLGLGEERGAQVAVVIRTRTHRPGA